MVVTTKTNFFFNPCSITNKFCGPIANIKLPPVKNPRINFDKEIHDNIEIE